MNNSNYNLIKSLVGSYSSRLNAWCNTLTGRQRLWLILVLSGAYMLMVAAMLVLAYRDQNKYESIEISHIHPLPKATNGIPKAIVPSQVISSDSTANYLNERIYGKE